MNCCGGNHDHQSPDPNNQPRSSWIKRNLWGLLIIGIIIYAIWQLIPDTGLKIGSLVPLLGVLICPLMMGAMMLFMGHNHGKNNESNN
ncbi:MAG: hypothetical protein ACM3NT_07860 [Methylocystaceae bacterium]